MISAGKLDKLVSLQRPTIQRTAAGEDLASRFVEYARPWANIKPISATERIRDENVVQLSSTHIITMHYTPALAADHRIVHRGRVFQISSLINVDDANREWRIIAQESI